MEGGRLSIAWEYRLCHQCPARSIRGLGCISLRRLSFQDISKALYCPTSSVKLNASGSKALGSSHCVEAENVRANGGACLDRSGRCVYWKDRLGDLRVELIGLASLVKEALAAIGSLLTTGDFDGQEVVQSYAS